MISFLDGPAAGVTLALRRAPLYLRVTRDTTADAEREWDALDGIEDEPRLTEEIHIYRRVGPASPVFVRPGGRYMMADYRHLPDIDIDELGLRHTVHWRSWAQQQPGPGETP